MEEEVKVFSTPMGDFNLSDFYTEIFKNKDPYGDHREQYTEGFDRDAYNKMASEILADLHDGKLSMNSAGKIVHVDGKKYGTGAAPFIQLIIDAAKDQIVKPITKEVQYADTEDDYRTYFMNKFFPNHQGEVLDYSLWESGGFTLDDVIQNLEDYKGFVNNSKKDWSKTRHGSKEQLLTALSNTIDELKNGSNTNRDLALYSMIGGDTEFLRRPLGMVVKPKSTYQLAYDEQKAHLIELGYSSQEVADKMKEWVDIQRIKNDEERDKYKLANDWANYSSQWNPQDSVIILDSLQHENIKDWIENTYNDEQLKPKYTNLTNRLLEAIKYNENASDMSSEQKLKEIIGNSDFESLADMNGRYTLSDVMGTLIDRLIELGPSEGGLEITESDERKNSGDVDSWYITESLDPTRGTILKYNRTDHSLTTVSVDPQKTPILLKLLSKKFMDGRKSIQAGTKYPLLAKKGAQLKSLKKFQGGGSSDIFQKLQNNYNKQKEVEERKIINELAEQTGEPVSRIKDRRERGKRTGHGNWYDWLRAGSTGLDILGAGASFIPVYGNAAGVTLGTIGTVGNLVADIADPNVSWGRVGTNLGLNAGMTALYLVPGGGSAKAIKGAVQTAKAVKTGKAALNVGKEVSKFGTKWLRHGIEVGMPLYGYTTLFQNRERVFELIDKYKNDRDNMTSLELQELYNYASLASGSIIGTKVKAGKVAQEMNPSALKTLLQVINDPFGTAFKGTFNPTWRARYEAGYARFNPEAQGDYNASLKLAGNDTGTIPVSKSTADKIKNILNSYKKNLKDDALRVEQERIQTEINNVIRQEKLKITDQQVKDLLTNFKGQRNDFKLTTTVDGNTTTHTIRSQDLNNAKTNLGDNATDQQILSEIYSMLGETTSVAVPFKESSWMTDISTKLGGKAYGNVLLEYSPASTTNFGNLSNNSLFNVLDNNPFTNARLNHGLPLFGQLSKSYILNGLYDKFGMEIAGKTETELLNIFNKYRNLDPELQNLPEVEAVGAFLAKIDKAPITLRDLENLIKNGDIIKTPDKPSTSTKLEFANPAKTPNKPSTTVEPGDISDIPPVPLHKKGNKIQALKQLRTRNFKSDVSKKMSQGGIVKADKGTVFDWYKQRYKHHNLEGWDTSKRSDYAGNLQGKSYHGTQADIKSAYDYNQSYVTGDKVTSDIQNYATEGKYTDIDTFIENYNKDINLVNDRWANSVSYGQTGAREGNLAHKRLYRSAVDVLGYEESQDDIYGSTTWHRRADQYEKDLKDLNEEELKSRTHKIIAPDGKEWVVYKNSDGTLTKTLSTQKVDTDVNEDGNDDGNGGDGGGKSKEVTPVQEDKFGKYIEGIHKAIPDTLALSRYVNHAINNKRQKKLGLQEGAAYPIPEIGNETLRGRFDKLMSFLRMSNETTSKADKIASLHNNPEAAAAIQLEYFLKAKDLEQQGKDIDSAAVLENDRINRTAEKERYLRNLKKAEESSQISTAKKNHDLKVIQAADSAATQNRDTLLSEFETRARQSIKQKQDINTKIAMNDLEFWWNNNVIDTLRIQQLRKEWRTTDSLERKLEIENEIQDIQTENARKLTPERNQRIKDILNNKFWENYDETETYVPKYSYVGRGKHGTKLNVKIKRTSDDLRELRKQIKHSIDLHQKTLNNLSKFTSLELKKMMGL